MDILVFYFSGTGNTKWAAETFCRQAEAGGHAAEAVSIDRLDPTDPALLERARGADYVGFAYPIYAAGMPRIMREFILGFGRRLREERVRKPAVFLCTFAYVNGFGPFCAAGLLRGSGLTMAAHLNLRLCNNVSTPAMKAGKLSAKAMRKRFDRARGQISALVPRLASGRRWITGVGPYLAAGVIIRSTLGKKAEKNYQQISVEMDRCSRCMRCVRECPTQSFRFENGVFSVLPGCTACLRCYNFCPQYAVRIGEYADPAVCPRYRGPNIL